MTTVVAVVLIVAGVGVAAVAVAGWRLPVATARTAQVLGPFLAGSGRPGGATAVGVDPALLVAPSLALAALGAGVGVVVWAAAGAGPLLGPALVVGLAVAGLAAPPALARRREARRLQRADDEVATFAGLLSVELRSGLGVDASIENVAAELDGTLAEQVRALATQIRLGMTRAEALERLRVALPVPNVERLVATLQHAEDLGAPMSGSLERLAADCTTRQFQRVREEAAKLPVKILFPVLLFIFPPMLLILGGPALLDILKAFD